MKIRTTPRGAWLLIGALGLAASAAPQQASTAPPPSPALQAQLARGYERLQVIAARAARVRDIDQLRNLQAAYGYYTDKSMQDAIAALFTDDATLEILGRGVFIGRDRIYEYMRRLGAPQPGALFNHMQLQPFLTISADGTTAQMRSRLFVMFGLSGRAAQWGEGIYENTFVKEHGVWKYKNLNGYQTYYTNYDAGWAKQSAAMFAPFPGYPPDMPQSIAYQPYPAPFIPPFHYRHPVTGR